MEEDIKTLEKFTKIVKGKDYNTKNGWHGYYDDELRVLGKTIENLIKGYRELEKRSTASLMYIDNECIRKSKIKEKIDNYEEMKKATYTDMTHCGDLRRDTVLEVLQVLQELMEDK